MINSLKKQHITPQTYKHVMQWVKQHNLKKQLPNTHSLDQKALNRKPVTITKNTANISLTDLSTNTWIQFGYDSM